MNYKTENCLSAVNFINDDIAKTLESLDANNAHGHDKISIRMLRLCVNSICKLLQLIFQQVMESGSFLSEWKKGNVVPIHKKDDKQCLKKLENCWKNVENFFEQLIFNGMFRFFIENKHSRDLNPVTSA